jgi:hypothetical protein
VMLRETEAEEKRERRDEEARALGGWGRWDEMGLGGCGVLGLANLRLLARDGQVRRSQMSLVVARLSSSGGETSINQLN